MIPTTTKHRVTGHSTGVRVYTGKKFGTVTLVKGSTIEQARRALDGVPTGFDTLLALRSANLLKGAK